MSRISFSLSLILEGSEPGIIEVSISIHVFLLPRFALAIVGFHLQKAAWPT